MFLQLTVSERHINNIELGIKRAVQLMNEVEEYKSQNFFKRFFSTKVYVEINLKYADEFLSMSQREVALILGYQDVYYLPKKQLDTLCDQFDRIMHLKLILTNFDEHIRRKKNVK